MVIIQRIQQLFFRPVTFLFRSRYIAYNKIVNILKLENVHKMWKMWLYPGSSV